MAGPAVLPDGIAGVAGDVRRRTVRGAPDRDGRASELAVAELGPAGAPAVVLAHGVGSSARFVAAACAAPLTAAGYRLVTYDARGHGSSSPARSVADHHLDLHAADLAAVVASVDGPVHAVGGLSLGAHAAVRGGGAHRRVLCLPAWTGPATPGTGPHAAVAAEVAATGIAAVTDRLAADTSMPTWLRTTLVTDYRRHDPASLTAALLALDGADAPARGELRRLAADRVPVGVVAWPDDPGHPLAVASRWADASGGTCTTLTLAALDDDLTRLGDAVVAAIGGPDDGGPGDAGPGDGPPLAS